MEVLGARIRKQRKSLGLTLREFSKKISISPSTLHKIEKGSMSPTIALMVEICHQLNTPVYSLLKETRSTLMHFKKDEQVEINHKNITLRAIADFGIINKDVNFSVLEVKKGAVLLKHSEPYNVFVYVVQGKITLEFDGETFTGDKGEAVYFDGSYPHSARAMSDAQLITIYIRDGG